MIDLITIQRNAKKRYPSFLASIIAGDKFSPIDFPAGKTPKEFHDLQREVILLVENSKEKLGYGYRLEMKSINMRSYGMQSIPKRIIIETEADYLQIINKQEEVSQFRLDIERIREKVPQLNDWIHRYPLRVIDYSDRWEDLLKVCQYFLQNPKPDLYIRELPIQVHTKFVEQNQKILRDLLEAILPIEKLVKVEGEREHAFEKRFSLKYEENQIRFRLLDRTLQSRYGFPATDMRIPVSEFRQLNLDSHPWFITENQMNFFTLPPLENSFALWGSGNAVSALKSIPWLSACPIYYWGDLDADGFEILSRLRAYFPQTRSIMMDRKTWEAFQEFSVKDSKKMKALPNLIPDEQNLYTYLVLHQKRLEQERICQEYAIRCLQDALSQNC